VYQYQDTITLYCTISRYSIRCWGICRTVSRFDLVVLYLTKPDRCSSTRHVKGDYKEDTSSKPQSLINVAHSTNKHTTIEPSRDTWMRQGMYVWRGYNRQTPIAHALMPYSTRFSKSRNREKGQGWGYEPGRKKSLSNLSLSVPVSRCSCP
jgi:hypothetical protein